MVCEFILKHKGDFADVYLFDKSVISGIVSDCNDYFILIDLDDSVEFVFLKEVIRISFKKNNADNSRYNFSNTKVDSPKHDSSTNEHEFSTGITLKTDSIAADFEEHRKEIKNLPTDHLSRIKKLSELRKDLRNIERDNFKKKMLSLDFVPTEVKFGQPDLTKPIYKYPTKKTR